MRETFPNHSDIRWSVGMGCMVGLHRFSNGDIWLIREHNDHFCTVRKATEDDMRLFDSLNRAGKEGG